MLFFSSTEYAMPAYSDSIKQSMDGSMDLEITYPNTVLADRVFSISFLIQNNGWESKQEISLILENPDNTFTPLPINITPAGMELDPETGVDLSNPQDNKSN